MKHYRVMLRDKLNFDRHPQKKVVTVTAGSWVPASFVIECAELFWMTWDVIGIEASR